jgi:hypothetical protein
MNALLAAPGSSMAPGEWCGDPDYACLEAVEHALQKRQGFDLASADIYAIGVTSYELVTDKLPVTLPEEEVDPYGAEGDHGYEGNYNEGGSEGDDSDDDGDSIDGNHVQRAIQRQHLLNHLVKRKRSSCSGCGASGRAHFAASAMLSCILRQDHSTGEQAIGFAAFDHARISALLDLFTSIEPH